MEKALMWAVPLLVIILFVVGTALNGRRNYMKAREQFRKTQEQLIVGREIILSSGVHGTIERIEAQVLHVKVAEGVCVKVDKISINHVVEERT